MIKHCASGTSLYLKPMFRLHFGTFQIILVKFFLKEIDMLDATVNFTDSYVGYQLIICSDGDVFFLANFN